MNTAGRILTLYDRLLGLDRNPDVPMVNAWAKVFELTTDGPQLEDDVVNCLQALRAELDLLRAKLLAKGAPEELLHYGYTRLRNATSTTLIGGGWKGMSEEQLKPENRLCFSWANWTLRDESEDDMPPEQMLSLRSELDSLEQSLQGTDMTQYLRGFVQRQISTIRSALQMYGVQGVKPIETALHQVAGAYTLEKSRVKEEHKMATESAKDVFSRVEALIEKTATTADRLDKIRNTSGGPWTLSTSVGHVLLAGHQNT